MDFFTPHVRKPKAKKQKIKKHHRTSTAAPKIPQLLYPPRKTAEQLAVINAANEKKILANKAQAAAIRRERTVALGLLTKEDAVGRSDKAIRRVLNKYRKRLAIRRDEIKDNLLAQIRANRGATRIVFDVNFLTAAERVSGR
jgi:hypothetical protein